MEGNFCICKKCKEKVIPEAPTIGPASRGYCCVWCKTEDDLVLVPVGIVGSYTPMDWLTRGNPAGRPWYITGYLAKRREENGK